MSSLLNPDFTFIVQGITGREAVNLTRECLDFGSRIVAGVTPGRKGREVHGVQVFATVEQGVDWSKVTAATLLSVAPLLVAFLIFQRQFVQSFMRAGIR